MPKHTPAAAAEVSQAKPKRTRKMDPAAAVARMRQAALEIPTPTAPPTDLLMVPLELIDTAAQVRTEFDDDTLAELAQDIATRGILQPLLLNRTEDGRFLLIAGERRFRAARLAGLAAVPAIAGTIDADAARQMQLAENIQREDLPLYDLAIAIRSLFDELGSLQAVADRVHKSKAWVSKRVSLTCSDYGYRARQLLEEGVTEDLEILGVVSQMEAIGWPNGYAAANQLADDLRAGKAGRQTARDRLKALKEMIANPPAADPDPDLEDDQEQDEEPTEPARYRSMYSALGRLEDLLNGADELQPVIDRFHPADWTLIHNHLNAWHELGTQHIGNPHVPMLKAIMGYSTMNGENASAIELAAFYNGTYGTGFDLNTFCRELMHVRSEH